MGLAKNKKKIHVGEFKTTDKIKKYILEVLESERISEYVNVDSFEKKFAEFIGTKYSIALNSGTSALIAGLEAIKNKYPLTKGTKIITTPLTYIATVNAIVLTGFSPVFIDINSHNFGISPQAIEEHLEKVKNPQEYSIILPVHLMGYPVEMDKIIKIASKYNLLILEDSAQAHGTIYKNQKVGTFSLLSAYSFYIAHNIQAGQLGAVVTDDKDISNLVKQIKSNGRICTCNICTRSQGKCPYDKADFDPRFTHNIIGYNFKTMEFQAAIALAQLEDVENIIKRRQKNVKILNEYLTEFSDILQLPKYSEDVSYLAYPLVLKDEKISINKLKYDLEKEGIETRPLFVHIPHQLAYAYLKKEYEGKLPKAEYLGKRGFYIGCHQYLEEEDLEYIYFMFKKVLGSLVR
jgi:dTDP-4-amino-4,6-dideoxygalactose transaminase